MCGFIPALDPPEVCPSSETNGSRVKLVVWLVALTIVYVGVPRNVDTFGLKKEVFWLPHECDSWLGDDNHKLW